MNRNFRESAQRLDPLFGATKIECAFQSERAQHLDIGRGEVAEMVGAEDLPPAHHAAIAAGIAAEIAEIAGAGEIEMTGRGI